VQVETAVRLRANFSRMSDTRLRAVHGTMVTQAMTTFKTMITINHVNVVDICSHDKEDDKDESKHNK
jgi:predicted S18 family serine protease